jgi:dihydrolipoamide dehydrogenase
MWQVAVIGGGPAGYIAAIKAAQLGGRVILFEKDTVGGTCLNRGCIPAKTYIKTAEYLHHIRRANTRGIALDTSALRVDMPRVVLEKDRIVRRLTGGVAGLLRANGVEQVHAEAMITAPGRVEAGGKSYDVQNIILCGGSMAGRIPVPGIEHPAVLTSDGILSLTEVPPRLAVIGGGVIGCEFATAFAAFGSKVTIVEALPRIAANMDAEISEAVAHSLAGEGINILTDAALERIEDRAGKPVLCAKGQRIEADTVLLSVGRTADLSCLGAFAPKLALERGKIVADDHMHTNLPGVYAAGDIAADRPMLAHTAYKMGEAAAVNAMGGDMAADLRLAPICLYTIPEAASVGLTEGQAAANGEVIVGRFPLKANGRALSGGEQDGFVKVVADKRYGEILGVHIVAAAASELIAEAAALMAAEVTVHEAAGIIHAHPSVSEALMEACADALGRCLHLPPKNK